MRAPLGSFRTHAPIATIIATGVAKHQVTEKTFGAYQLAAKDVRRRRFRRSRGRASMLQHASDPFRAPVAISPKALATLRVAVVAHCTVGAGNRIQRRANLSLRCCGRTRRCRGCRATAGVRPQDIGPLSALKSSPGAAP